MTAVAERAAHPESPPAMDTGSAPPGRRQCFHDTRAAVAVFGRDVWPRLYYGLDTRMDSLLLGCLIGLLAAWQLLRQRGWLLTATWYAGALRHFTTAYASGSMWSRASCHPSMRPSSSTATPSSLAAPYAPAVAAGPAATATAG